MRWKRHMARRSLNWNADLIRQQLQRESSWWQSAARMRMASMRHTVLCGMKPNSYTQFTNCVSESENYVQSFWRSERRRHAGKCSWGGQAAALRRQVVLWGNCRSSRADRRGSQGAWRKAVRLMLWHHFDSNFRCSQKHTMNGVENTLRQTGKLYLLQPENSFPESSSSNLQTLKSTDAMQYFESQKALWYCFDTIRRLFTKRDMRMPSEKRLVFQRAFLLRTWVKKNHQISWWNKNGFSPRQRETSL